MTPTELAEVQALQKAYDEMQARQRDYEKSLTIQPQTNERKIVGCVFAKDCHLPEGIINYGSFSGFVPTVSLKDYGNYALLGGRALNQSGRLPLKTITGTSPVNSGSLALAGAALASGGAAEAAALGSTLSAGVAAGAFIGLVALLAPSNLADSALYTEEQLRELRHARTRVRLRIEEQADGTLKGYGYNTQNRRKWELIPVIKFTAQGSEQIADFGDGVTLVWTPAVDQTSTMGIPPLESAPQAPTIWIYPPTQAADDIIVDPIYPDEYKDFILVFPINSGIKPVYIVYTLEFDAASYHGKKNTPRKSKGPENGQEALDNSLQVKPTSPRRIGIDPATNEYVVFDKTAGDVYHGHVRPWDKLHQDMKNALIKAEKVDNKGNILGAEK